MPKHTHFQIIAGLMAALILCFFIALTSGGGTFDTMLAWQAVFNYGDPELANIERNIILDIRVPRTLGALLVGSALAVSGAVLQGLFRNSLADPSLLGVSAGAAVFAALGGAFGVGMGLQLDFNTSVFTFADPRILQMVSAASGGLLVTWLVYSIGSYRGYTSTNTMLLAGIALNALLGAVLSAISWLADDQQLRQVVFWGMGSLSSINIIDCLIYLPLWFIGGALAIRLSTQLNQMLLGESEAQSLGINIQKLKRSAVLITALLTGGGVAIAGIVAFVGLVVPHIIRLAIGPDNRLLVPASALLGAIVLIVADTLARSIFYPIELPVGLITAALGAPFFLYLLIQNMRRLT